MAADDVFKQISTILFGEHINQLLKVKGLPPLDFLKDTPGLYEDLLRMLWNPHFVKSVICERLTRQNDTFTMALLVVVDHVH